MSDLNHLLLDAFPEAAVLIRQGQIAAANPMARHYLPQLEPGTAPPPYLPLEEASSASGTFTAGLTTYSFTVTQFSDGLLLLFRPAPQTALTDAQLDGALRQLRSFLAEFMTKGPGQDSAAFRKSFYRMFRLVDNLDFMRLAGEGCTPAFRPVTIDLAGLCSQMAGQASPLLQQGGITLDFRSDPASLLIPGDSALLQRLLLELISNSARALGRGEIRMRLRSRGTRALLTLSDSGAPPTQRQLAAMLQQDADHAIPSPQAGAGLGLSIARHIAALHGGSLLVEWGQSSPSMILSLPSGPLDPRATLSSPPLQRDGGLSPLLVALADALPAEVFALADLD